MILTEEYFKSRSEAMQWLGQKQEKRNFAAGLKILVQSGYKPNVQKLLLRKGELPWTMEKLTSCLRDVVQVYYNPDDPRFEDVPDADLLNDSTGEKPPVDEQRRMAGLPDDDTRFRSMPEVMQMLIRNFADAYKQRARLARQRYELGEANDENTVEQRKTLGDSIDKLTAYMDVLAAMREAYEKDGTLPDLDKAQELSSAAVAKAESAGGGKVDYKSMPTDKLKTRKKSLTNQITRKENMLLYQTETRQEHENPLPESPRRSKLLKQIENLKAEKSKVEYELAERI